MSRKIILRKNYNLIFWEKSDQVIIYKNDIYKNNFEIIFMKNNVGNSCVLANKNGLIKYNKYMI